MTAGEQQPALSFVVHRDAGARLRGGSGPLRARVHWPAPSGGMPALLLLLPDAPDAPDTPDTPDTPDARTLCSRTGMVVLAPEHPATEQDAITVLEWAADHADELDADPERLFVAGGDLATAVQRHAEEQGWPPVTHYVVDP